MTGARPPAHEERPAPGTDPRFWALLRTSLIGLGAWLVALAVVGLVGLTGDPPISDDVPQWKGLVWLFLDAQFVPVVETTGREAVAMDLLDLLETPLIPLAYAAPPVALALAGWGVARTDLLAELALSPAAAGLAVCGGYLVPTLVVAAVSPHTIVVDLPFVNVVRKVTPRFGWRLVLVATGYPVVFGGIGGLAAWRFGPD